MTVRSKFGSSSGGVAISNRPFVGAVPGITRSILPARSHVRHDAIVCMTIQR